MLGKSTGYACILVSSKLHGVSSAIKSAYKSIRYEITRRVIIWYPCHRSKLCDTPHKRHLSR
ncbi:hypothetical protein VP466E531_P0086 [Vibrio phage 466E53-1]|nr:hypothetical protein VP466E531_P0086 [Vibrio phage 466E53-1]